MTNNAPRYAVKVGVCLHGLHPRLEAVIWQLDDIYASAGISNMPTITSGRDGDHSTNSLHYLGRALDLRTRDLPSWKVGPLVAALKLALGDDFDVVLEKDHIHLELDPD